MGHESQTVYNSIMNDDQFTKLFKYVEQRFDSVETKLDAKSDKADIQQLMNTIDAFIKRLDDAEIEQVSRDAQWNRLLEWARKVSEKTGIPLPDL